MAMEPAGGQALLVLDARFVLELLDLFFGGAGAAPADTPAELSPAAEALVGRVGAMLAPPLAGAWEPLSPTRFTPGRVENNPLLLGGIDGEDAVVVTRLGLAVDAGPPTFLDILYPVPALKPLAPSLMGKVSRAAAEPDPAWRARVARAAMEVSFPVRSVLAEPTVRLSRLMSLQPGDVIPIALEADVPVMVGRMPLGRGTVGTSNGRAAVRLTKLCFPKDPQ
jgi:flagellar motor switch protein FliM